jgi:hypothetical protein
VQICRAALTSDQPIDCSRLDANRWHGITAAALEHGLIHPLYCFLVRAKGRPENVLDNIRNASLEQAVRNYRLTDALLEVFGAFEDGGIDVFVIKGPAVALMTTGQIAAREFTDLDLLIRPDDLNRAQALLLQLGYTQMSAGRPDHRTEKDNQFVRIPDNVMVELHWALTPGGLRFPIEDSGVWARAQTLHFQNAAIRTLGLEDTVAALCIHGLKHGWYSLKWAFDIAQLIAYHGSAIDWQTLIRRCDSADCTRVLLIGIRLASDLFGVTPPAAVSITLDVPAIFKPADAIRSSLLHNTRLSEREIISLLIQTHDRLWNRLFVAVSISVPELPRLLPEVASPITSGPLRFITRPIRLMNRYGYTWLRTALFGR